MQYVLLFLILAVKLTVSNFTELHALTTAARSYALLVDSPDKHNMAESMFPTQVATLAQILTTPTCAQGTVSIGTGYLLLIC